jgi:hypothetical protein
MGSRSRSGGGGWSTLTGSEKQISWANDIRAGAQEALNTVKGFATTKEAKAVVAKWESKMKSMTDAKSWIDARYDAPKAMTSNNPNVKGYVSQQNNAKVKQFLGQFNSWLGS